MDEKQYKLNILERFLGVGKKTAKGNYAFVCPNGCHASKLKLEVNIETEQWECWICGPKENFKGNSIKTLLDKYKAPSEYYSELKYSSKSSPSINKNIVKIQLPKEFKSLKDINEKDIVGRNALVYVKKRGLTNFDIIKYNIGYCEDGPYSNMIIIPSYDSSGNLNYFTARSFLNNNKINPEGSRDIIGFELFINWNVPIIICEGAFDAISIKRNAIPLFGKNISQELRKKIIKNKTKQIYIALDKDAQKEALKYCQEFLEMGKEVFLVELEDKDPNELGFEKFTNLVHNSKPLTFADLLFKKINS